MCVALYEALYGQEPFAGETFEQRAATLRQGVPPSPPTRRDLPAELGAVVVRAGPAWRSCARSSTPSSPATSTARTTPPRAGVAMMLIDADNFFLYYTGGNLGSALIAVLAFRRRAAIKLDDMGIGSATDHTH